MKEIKLHLLKDIFEPEYLEDDKPERIAQLINNLEKGVYES